MSVLLLDSFDDGLFSSKWTYNNGPSVVTTTPRTGTSCLAYTSNGYQTYRELGAGANNTIVWGGGIFPISFLGTKFLSFKSDAGVTQHISLLLNTSGGFEIYRGGDSGNTPGTLLGSTAPNLVVAGSWYHLEVKVFLDDTTGTVELRLNNTVVFTFVGDTKNAGTETVISRVFMGNSAANSSMRMDDVYILNAAGAVNNNFLGDSRIHSLLPDANGNYSQWVGSDANSVDNYLLVDETPPNTSDYVGSGTSGNKDSYNFPSLPAAVTLVRAVGQRSYAAASDAGPRAARNLVRIGAVDYVGADYNLGATYLLYENLYDVSPATAVAFTPAEFNGAEWGIEVRA